MPITKPAFILHAISLLLVISPIAHAETGFDFSSIPAAERQQLLQKIATEVNQELPYTSHDGSISVYKISVDNLQISYDAKVDLDKMTIPPTIRSPEAIRGILQPSPAELFCRTPDMVSLNKQISFLARFHVKGWQQPISVTMPRGHCAAYRNKTREELAADSVAAMFAIMLPHLNQSLPIQSGDATLERVTFDSKARVMHQYITHNGANLAALSPSAIRRQLQQQASLNICNNPSSMRMNRYFATTAHTTLPNHPTPFTITIPKGHCARQR